MSSVTLAHISDIHLPLTAPPQWRSLRFKQYLSLSSWYFKRRHVHTYEALKKITADVHRQHPDLVSLTGDVTNIGTMGEFKNARAWLQEENFENLLLVPGNHDTLADSKNHEKFVHWYPWTASKTANFARPSLRFKDNVALIGLNSAVPSLPFLATGQISSVQLAHLSHILRHLRHDGYCRVIMLHHSPLRGHVTNRKGLKNLRLFQKIMRDEGAELILHGHSHNTNVSTIPHTEIPVVSAPSASHTYESQRLTGGWNKIRIQKCDNMWDIRIQPRLLDQDNLVKEADDTYRCKIYTKAT